MFLTVAYQQACLCQVHPALGLCSHLVSADTVSSNKLPVSTGWLLLCEVDA